MHSNISLQDRQRIVALHDIGFNLAQIANQTGLAWKTVERWVTRFEEEGSVKTRPRSQRMMVQQNEENGFIRTSHYANMFETSALTVRRALHGAGVHHRKPANKPGLTAKHKHNRLSFARNLWGWMSAAGPGELVAQETGRATAANYVEAAGKHATDGANCLSC